MELQGPQYPQCAAPSNTDDTPLWQAHRAPDVEETPPVNCIGSFDGSGCPMGLVVEGASTIVWTSDAGDQGDCCLDPPNVVECQGLPGSPHGMGGGWEICFE